MRIKKTVTTICKEGFKGDEMKAHEEEEADELSKWTVSTCDWMNSFISIRTFKSQQQNVKLRHDQTEKKNCTKKQVTTKWREWTKKARKCFEISISSVERTNRCLHLSVSSLFCFALRLCRHENAQIQVFISVLFSVVSRCPLNLHSRSQCQWRERMKAKRTESRKYWTRMQVTNAKARVRFPWQVVSLNAKPKKKNCNQWRRDDNTFYYCHFFSSFWVRENSIFRSLSMAVFSIAVSIQSSQIGKQTNAENSFQ